MVLTSNIFDASMIPIFPYDDMTFDKAFACIHFSIWYLELQVSFSILCAPPSFLVVPNIDNVYRVIKILSLMEMMLK